MNNYSVTLFFYTDDGYDTQDVVVSATSSAQAEDIVAKSYWWADEVVCTGTPQ